MTVAPESPPVLARRDGSRRLRVVVDRTPAGVVAFVEPPRPRAGSAPVPAVVVPAAPVEPGIGREHHPAEPGIGREHRPADPAPRSCEIPRRSRAFGPSPAATAIRTRPAAGPAAGTAEARPAAVAPVGLRPERTRGVVPGPVGVRVVRTAPGHLRLTRRGRLVTAAATLLIAVLALVGVVSRAPGLRETAPVPASAPAQVVVAPGETLWSIAERIAPDRDPRTVVAGIQRLNDLPTADVRAGQTLRLRAP